MHKDKGWAGLQLHGKHIAQLEVFPRAVYLPSHLPDSFPDRLGGR